MSILNIYLIHTIQLANRSQYINKTLDIVKKIAERYKFDVKIHIIHHPSVDAIESNIEMYNKMVKFEKESGDNTDEQFNTFVTPLNTAQISNIEKHKEVYKRIVDNNELHFIIEDDVLAGDDYITNTEKLFENLSNNTLNDWDILLTCMASIEKDNPLEIRNSRDQYKFFICKSSYFIRPEIASRLLKYFEIFRYNLKIGISKFVWDNKDVKSRVLNKHTFIEGSKIGIFPTSTNNTNYLHQNFHFVNLSKISNNPEITDQMLKEAISIYNDIKHLGSPDVLHTMGLIYFKRKDYDEAKKYMEEACDKLKTGHGNISKNCEILNNAINMFQFDQPQLEECKKKKSKYAY